MKKAILVLSIFSVFGCERQSKSPLNIEKIRNGEQLHLAQELSVDGFFQIWIRKDIPWKGNLQISEIYKDDTFVYFFEQLFRNQSVYLGDRVFTKEPQLFKVNALALQTKFAEYATIDGFEIRRLCAEQVSYFDENNGDRLPTHLFKYEMKEGQIFIAIEVGEKSFQFIYDIREQKLT
jgi:hypothetical protein